MKTTDIVLAAALGLSPVTCSNDNSAAKTRINMDGCSTDAHAAMRHKRMKHKSHENTREGHENSSDDQRTGA